MTMEMPVQKCWLARVEIGSPTVSVRFLRQIHKRLIVLSSRYFEAKFAVFAKGYGIIHARLIGRREDMERESLRQRVSKKSI
jgi:hypothetical protein